MPQGERIHGRAGQEGGLRFVDDSQQSSNLKGNISYAKIVYYDDFLGKAIDNTNDYTVAAVGSGTATIGNPHHLLMTTSAEDDDDIDVAMGLEWYGQYDATIEARFRVQDVDKTAFNIGFSDATGEAADLIAMMYDTVTLTSTASNFAGFLHDADATTSNLYCVSVKDNSDGSVIDTSSTPADATWYTVRVELVDNGTTCDAKFYVNSSGLAIDPYNDFVGEELDAVNRTTALCPYIGFINHGENAANTAQVDYLKIWQDRR